MLLISTGYNSWGGEVGCWKSIPKISRPPEILEELCKEVSYIEKLSVCIFSAKKSPNYSTIEIKV
jgi:hypothetical protein